MSGMFSPLHTQGTDTEKSGERSGGGRRDAVARSERKSVKKNAAVYSPVVGFRTSFYLNKTM
jgi:hypothetical protein